MSEIRVEQVCENDGCLSQQRTLFEPLDPPLQLTREVDCEPHFELFLKLQLQPQLMLLRP